MHRARSGAIQGMKLANVRRKQVRFLVKRENPEEIPRHDSGLAKDVKQSQRVTQFVEQDAEKVQGEGHVQGMAPRADAPRADIVAEENIPSQVAGLEALAVERKERTGGRRQVRPIADANVGIGAAAQDGPLEEI